MNTIQIQRSACVDKAHSTRTQLHRALKHLFALVLAAATPAIANTITSVNDANGVHVNYAVAYWYTLMQMTPNGNTWNGSISDNVFPRGGDATIGGNLASFSDAAGEHVFYIDWNGNLDELLFAPNTSQATSNTNLTQGSFPAPTYGLGGNYPLTTGLTACSGIAGDFVFYVDVEQHLIALSSENGGSSFSIADLTGTTGPTVSMGSNLVSFCSQAGGPQVFYVDTNQNVDAFSGVQVCYGGFFKICNRAWLISNITAAAGASATYLPPDSPGWPAIPLTGFQDSFGTHIFYVASNQGVSQLWYQSSGTWLNQNVMPSAPVIRCPFCPPPPPILPPAATTALSSLVDAQGQQHVIYIDTNLGISELSHDPNATYLTLGNGWYYASLTTAAGVNLSATSGNPADSGCSMMQLTSVLDSAGDQRVYYVDKWGDLNQLLLSSGSWTYQDVFGVPGTNTTAQASSCANL